MPIAVITGASSPLGHAIALALAAKDCELIVHAHENLDAVERLRDELILDGKKCEIIVADLAHENGQEQFCASVESLVKSVDVLVHNAASFGESNLRSLTRDIWRSTLQLNAEAPLFITKRLLPLLRNTGQSSVIHIIDAMSTRVWSTHLAYESSKILLAHFTQSLAIELAPDIRVNAVAPGLVHFPSDWNSLRRERVLEKIPLKRTPNVLEIASTVAFLACDATSTTGEIVIVDGGRHLVP